MPKCSLGEQVLIVFTTFDVVSPQWAVINFRLKKYGMGFYIYAPKDDAKHRKKWRKKYHSFEKSW